MISQTTALRKIASLKKRIKVIRGGQGSSKTFSILILLINHAASKPDKEILIISSELTKMRLTVIKDFVKIMKSFGIYNDSKFLAGTLYRFPNGSFIKFIGLDKSDVGKGLRSDIAYFNEVNKCDAESYRQVASRAKQVICDYNPDAPFFIDQDVIGREDCDFLQLTYEDNEMLDDNERNEILNYHVLGYGVPYDPNRKEALEPVNSYWANLFEVYGLGNIGSLQGVVFSNWSIIDSIPPDAKRVGYGVDFGYTNDPTTTVIGYEYNGQRIYDEVIYQTGLSNGDHASLIKSNDISKRDVGYADSADPKSIDELCKSGLTVKPVTKGADSIMYGIGLMQEKPFLITKRSTNLKKELENYTWAKDKDGNEINKPIDAWNHLIDAARYLEMMLKIDKPKKIRARTFG
jgi:phage terminase large subunit